MGEIDVSIPSQAGILLAATVLPWINGRPAWSQYPLRRASSWRAAVVRDLSPDTWSLNTLSGGHPLGGSDAVADREATRQRLNTLSGGHPLGGRPSCRRCTRHASSQYPLRRASSWREQRSGTIREPRIVSQYPLRRASSWRLAVASCGSCRRSSQYPLRRASSWRHCDKAVHSRCRGLNTLSGGHPLGGRDRHPGGRSWHSSLNTLSGGHPLGGADTWQSGSLADDSSQYPLRRASSWRQLADCEHCRARRVSIPSQAGILLAASCTVESACATWTGLNTLSGGHPLGGARRLSV